MEIKISKCSAKCHGCDRPFVHEEKVHSLVVSDEDTLVRRDYCAPCHSELQQPQVFCSWNVHFSDPKALEAEQHEAFSPLRRLFYDLAVLQERNQLAQAYLAAQLLKRQKVFRQIKESEEKDGAEKVTLFLDRVGNRLIETRDLNFTYTELDEARVHLMAQLQELEAPPPTPVAETTVESQQSEQTEEHVQTTIR
jgi:hypothetical protein